jgi:hypothetical protein
MTSGMPNSGERNFESGNLRRSRLLKQDYECFENLIYESFVKSVIHELILLNVFRHTLTGRP